MESHPPSALSPRARAGTFERGPAERLAAWLVTGPVGHFYSGVADLATFSARLAAERIARGLRGVRRRDRRGPPSRRSR